MTINLTPDQAAVLSQKQAIINATKLELTHAEEKLNLLITGLAMGLGIQGNFTYSLSGSLLQINLPEPTPIVEE
jgi:hypothetical protein